MVIFATVQSGSRPITKDKMLTHSREERLLQTRMGFFITIMIPELGCVYFIKLNGLSPVKIGFSSSPSPQDRLDAIRTAAPFGAELLGFILTPVAKHLETKIHGDLREHRLQGEWFDISIEKVSSLCQRYISEHQKNEMSAVYELYSKRLRYGCQPNIDPSYNYPANTLDFLNQLTIKLNLRYEKDDIFTQYVSFSGRANVTKRSLTASFIKFYVQKGFDVVCGKSKARWIMIQDQIK